MKVSVSATFVFAGQLIPQAVARAAAWGFDGIEFQNITAAAAENHADAIAAAGLRVALVNLASGDLADGGIGVSADAGRRDAFDAALADGAAIARTLRPAVIHIGPARVPSGGSRGSCLSTLADNAARARDALAPLGCRVSIEVLNRADFPGLVVDTIETAAALIERIDGDGIVLQYDIYHAVADGRDPIADIARIAPLIGHVQFADYPGRGEPGTGRIDFPAVFAALRDARYARFVGAEYIPTGDNDFGWLALLKGNG